MREDHDDLRNLAADANDSGRRARAELERRAGVAMTPSADAFKENNPKDAFGILKASLSWVSMPVVMEMAVGMAEGGYKYGGHNYRVCAPRASVYVDGAIRHIVEWWEGQDNDSDAQIEINNIAKAITSLCVLRDAMIQGNYIDDRPPPSPKGWLKSLNEKMKVLAAKNPAPVARYLAGGKRGPGRILDQA
ncbi:TPA: dATP/dGTP diphosphohydrolase domain-containing protein [Escherichia coli]|uniref:dATP/dGTP diphosphohydrolase domain-containing protein n=1 Tax=Bradyrhizobium sp. TaxID=376 RepID=UPI0025BD2D3A|nr:dATP/dGTP diphosphohydrolase domain-containing protein [Bradyrhizobium sp.]MCA3567309.1 hypothetical protein [Bradyrhizobium sp.]MCA3575739.1 hypothetical protein [Bradyrhizobium sp.]